MDLIPSAIADYTLECYTARISVRSRIIYWIIILLISGGIILLPFIYIDVSVQGRGYFQADIENQVIIAPFQGRITYSSAHKGERVEKGDTLLVIDSEALKAQVTSLDQSITVNNLSVYDLQILTRLDTGTIPPGYLGLKTPRYQEDFRNFRSQLLIQFRKYTKKMAEHERNVHLFNQLIIPLSEFENSQYSVKTERDNLVQILLNKRSGWQNDLASRRVDSARFAADLQQCYDALINRIILAPASGEILESSDLQEGALVTQGQEIAVISPAGDLVANVFITPDKIGLINEDQQVLIQVDAFNYHEWGMLRGSILDISDDLIVENSSTAYFRIVCKPSSTSLSLSNGKSASIKKGMSFNARIVVIRRSLFNLLYDKADNWFNPYTDNRK